MRTTRLVRFLTVVSVFVVLVAVPVAVQAAPRSAGEDERVPSILDHAWEWVSSLWGAGGGSFEPGGRSLPPPTTAAAESRVPVTEDRPAERLGRGIHSSRLR
jgi:hypothetical protein